MTVEKQTNKQTNKTLRKVENFFNTGSWLPTRTISGIIWSLTGSTKILSLYFLSAQQCRGKFAKANKMG
jgi:hypothetical protein